MTLPHDITKLQSEMSAAVKAHWKAFLFKGIVLSVLGLAAMIVPPLASLAATIFLGWMFLISVLRPRSLRLLRWAVLPAPPLAPPLVTEKARSTAPGFLPPGFERLGPE